jgi:hypothetical protein
MRHSGTSDYSDGPEEDVWTIFGKADSADRLVAQDYLR